MSLKIALDKAQIEAICKRWKIKELSIFGSAIREDFTPESDVDVLVVFHDEAEWSIFDILEIKDELKSLFGREVDLVEKDAIRNPFRRHHILNNHEVIYATG